MEKMLQSFREPNTLDIRGRIENVNKRSYRNALKFGWLGLCRVSEIVGKQCLSDKGTTARGPTGGSVGATVYEKNGEECEVAIFTVNTSKRGGLPRSVACPLDPVREPWAGELCDYFKEFSSGQYVFNFTRQKLWQVAREAFAGFKYPIEEYQRVLSERELRDGMQIIMEKEDGQFIVKTEKHHRVMGTHAIRHLRAMDLLNFYGFTVQELSVIGGWTLRSMTGASSSISRYVHLDWQSYFPKLLRERY